MHSRFGVFGTILAFGAGVALAFSPGGDLLFVVPFPRAGTGELTIITFDAVATIYSRRIRAASVACWSSVVENSPVLFVRWM